jgi:hypothetical protein
MTAKALDSSTHSAHIRVTARIEEPESRRFVAQHFRKLGLRFDTEAGADHSGVDVGEGVCDDFLDGRHGVAHDARHAVVDAPIDGGVGSGDATAHGGRWGCRCRARHGAGRRAWVEECGGGGACSERDQGTGDGTGDVGDRDPEREVR